MNILNHFISGVSRSLRSWKWILIIWIVTLFLVALMALPFKAELKTILGPSMITEKLADGINIDVFANSGTGMKTLMSSLTSGFFLVMFLGILANVFFNGGLFNVVRNQAGKQNASEFFGGAASNFWSFLVIWLLLVLIILFVGLLVIGLPVLISRGSQAEGSTYRVLRISFVVMFLILPVFILVADYARAWQAASGKKEPFRAVGQGFKNTFRHFFSSWVVMFVVILVQALYTLIVFKIVSRCNPASGGGIFLLFILTQLLFFIKLLMRSWRYGCVTSLFEKNNV